MPIPQTNRLAAITTPLGADVLAVRSISVTEQLGRLTLGELELISENPNISFTALIGQTVSVRLDVAGGAKRYFHGYVSGFEMLDHSGRYPSYGMTIVPWLWFLTQTSDCRIFNNKSVPTILKEVFDSHGFSDVKLQLSNSYGPWEYCVQYRETDFNFVSRLMEQEGITYYFEHEAGAHFLVLCDSPGSHLPFPGYDSITFQAAPTGDVKEERIRRWTAQQRHLSGAFAHVDYDFKKPRVDLTTQTTQPGEHGRDDLEVFDFPGEYEASGDGSDWAKVRMQELRTQAKTYQGEGDVRGLAAGSIFELKGSSRTDQDAKYLTTSVRHSVRVSDYESGATEDSSYRCSFTAQDAAAPFRTPRQTPKPLVSGIQTAVVTGPSGEEIYTDEYGRIKVQFHWDRYGKKDENTTCWMRVATSWAGQNWGMISIPRIGQEVVVAFLEGDPDQPVVVGSVYNAIQMPPYSLPSEKTKSTMQSRSSKGGAKSNFNELRFEDKKGSEQLFLHAEKDMDVRVKNDAREIVKKDRHLIVDGKQMELVKGDKHAHVKGKHVEKVDGDVSLTVGGKRHEKVGTVESVEAGMELHLKAGMKVIIEAGVQLSLKAGGGFIDIGPAGVTIQGTLVLINSGGAAGAGTAASPESPEDPDEADDGSKTGKM